MAYKTRNTKSKRYPTKKGKGRKRYNKKTAVLRVVRREIFKQEETKVKSLAPYTSNVLAMNIMYTMSPFQTIALGTSDSERIGQSIYVRHVKITGSVSNNPLIMSAGVRILVYWMDEKFNTQWGAWNYATGPSQTALFYDTTSGGAANQLNAIVNNKLGNPVIYDRVIMCTQQQPVANGQLVVKNFKIDLPIFKKFTYEYGSTPYCFNDKQLYISVIPWSPLGTPGTTQPINLSVQGIVTYKDS